MSITRPRWFHRFVAITAVVAIAFFAVLQLPAEAGQTFTVTTQADTYDGVCDFDCSLRDAVSAANADAVHDSILLPPGTYVLSGTSTDDNINLVGDLDVSEPLNIIASSLLGATIDGSNVEHTLEVEIGVPLAVVGVDLIGGQPIGFFGPPGTTASVTVDGALDIFGQRIAGTFTLGGGLDSVSQKMVTLAAEDVSLFVGTGSGTPGALGLDLTNGSGQVVYLTRGIAGEFSGDLAILGVPAFTASGTIAARFNETGGEVDETVPTAGGSTSLIFGPGQENLRRFEATNLDLDIGGFATLSGGLSIEEGVVGSGISFLVGGSDVSTFVGQPAGPGVSLSGATFGAAIFGDGEVTVDATGAISLDNVPGLTLAGTASVRYNDTGGAVSQTVTVGDTSVDLNFTADQGNYVILAGSSLNLDVAGFASLTGNFGFETGGGGPAGDVLFGGTGISAFLGDPGGVGVSLSGADFGAAIFGDGEVTLSANGTVSLDNVPGLTLAGSASVLYNNTGGAVNVVAPTGVPGGLLLDFAENTEIFTAADVIIDVGGFAALSGDFGFQNAPAGSVADVLIGATNVASFVGDPLGVGLDLSSGSLALALYPGGGVALEAGGTLELVGVPGITALGTGKARFNDTGTAISESVPVGGGTTALTFTADEGNLQRFEANGLNFGIGGFATLSGNFSFETGSASSTADFLIGGSGISTFVGQPGGVGVSLAGADFGAAVFPDGSIALDATGTVSLNNVPGLTLAGTASALFNNTGGAVSETVTVSGQMIDLDFTSVQGNLQRFTGSNVDIDIAGSASLSGNFGFETGSGGAQGEVLIGGTGINAFLGDPGGVGVSLTSAEFGAALFDGGTFAVDATGTVSLDNVPGLTLAGTASVLYNNTGGAVNVVVPTGAPGGKLLDFAADTQIFSATGVTVDIAGFASLSGDFGFQNAPSGSSADVLIGASNVSAFVGDPTGVGIDLTSASLALALYPGGGVALEAGGSLELLGVPTVTAAGTASARYNTTGGAVSETVPVGAGTALLEFAADEGSLQAFEANGLDFAIGDFATLSGNFSFEAGGTGTTADFLIGGSNIETFVGEPGGVGVRLTNGSFAAAVYPNGTLALESTATLAVEGVPGLTLSGNALLRFNNTLGAVDETVTVAGVPTNIHFEAFEGDLFSITATGIDLNILGLPDLPTWNEVFTFTKVGVDINISLTGEIELFDLPGNLLLTLNYNGVDIDILFGANFDSFGLGDLGIPLPPELIGFDLPELTFVWANLDPGLSLSIPSADLSLPELAFYGGLFDIPDFTLNIDPGLNLAGLLPSVILPDFVLGSLDIPDLPGLNLSLDGNLAFDFSGGIPAVDYFEIDIIMPPEAVLPGLPDWITQKPGTDLILHIAFLDTGAGAVAEFGIAGTYIVIVDGTPLEFDLSLGISSEGGGSLIITGATTDTWIAPYGVDWLTLNGLSLELQVGGASSVTLDSAFLIGAKEFGLAISIAQVPGGGVSASIDATASSLLSTDLVALLVAAGVPIGGLDLPEVGLNNVAISVSTAPGGVGFALSAEVPTPVLGADGSQFLIAVIPTSTGPQVIGGFALHNITLGGVVPALSGTLAGGLSFDNVALVVAAGAGGATRADLPAPVIAFFDGVYGTTNWDLELVSGVNLISSVSLAGTDIAQAMNVMGIPDEPIIISGGVSIPGFGPAGLGVSLSADLPPMSPTPRPEWLNSAQLAFYIDISAGSGVTVGIRGELDVTIQETPTKSTNLIFGVAGEFSGPPLAITLIGTLNAPAPWIAPFEIDWLEVRDLGMALTVEMTPPGFGIELSGNTVIVGKNLDLTMALTLSPVGIPTNFAFRAASESTFGGADFIALAEALAGQTGTLSSSDSAGFELRPISSTQPIEIKFALRDTAFLNAGIALSGSLWIDTDFDGTLEHMMTVDIAVNTSGVFIHGSGGTVTLGPVTLANTDLEIILAPLVPRARFAFTGDVTTVDGTTRIEIILDSDFLAGTFDQLFQDLDALVAEWGTALETFAADPIGTIDILLGGTGEPVWLAPLEIAFAEISAAAEGAALDLLDGALGGFELTIPAGVGLPAGGVGPEGCPLGALWMDGDRCWSDTPDIDGTPDGGYEANCGLWVEQGGLCYSDLPDPDGTPDGGVDPVCSIDTPLALDGKCYTILPDTNGWPDNGVSSQTCSPYALHSDGKCYSFLPNNGTPGGGTDNLGCAWPNETMSGGKCYSRTPGTKYNHWHAVVSHYHSCTAYQWATFQHCGTHITAVGYDHEHTDTDGTPDGGANVSCPAWALQLQGSRCYTFLPSSGTLSGTQPYTSCLLASGIHLFLNGGDNRCYTVLPNNGTPDSGNDPSACTLANPTWAGGRCYQLFGEPDADGSPDGGLPPTGCAAFTFDAVYIGDGRCYSDFPTTGSPPGGEAPLCDIFHPWESGGRCYTFPPTPTISTGFIPGLCAILPIPCTADELFNGNVKGQKSSEANTLIENFVFVPELNNPPDAHVGGPYLVLEGGTFQASGALSFDLDFDPLTYQWDADGDGVFELTGVTPIISAAGLDGPSLHFGIMRVSDGVETDQTSFQYSVENAPPVVDAGVSRSTHEGALFALSGVTYSDSGTPDTHAAMINWGDGTPTVAGSVSVAGPGSGSVIGSHVYADNGVYTVSVTVSDDDGASDADTFAVTVANRPASVNAGASVSGVEGQSVGLSAAGFNDPGTADTHTSSIDWGDGSLAQTGVVTESPFGPPGLATGANGSISGTHIYADNGVYTVTVTVTDDEGAVSNNSTMFIVGNDAPIVEAGPNGVANEGGVFTVPNATFNDPGSLDVHTATIDWGDGSLAAIAAVTETPSGPPGSGSGINGTVTGSHSYAENGTYIVTIVVNDDDGGTASDTFTISVANLAPVVEAGANRAGTEGSVISLQSASFSDAGILDSHVAVINWGDASPNTSATIAASGPGTGTLQGAHVYADNGTYTATVTVTDDENAATSDTLVVTVNNVAPTVNAGADQTADEGSVVSLAPSTFNDLGTSDTHAATINWGDGTTPDIGAVSESPFGPPGSTAGANGTASGSHVYADNGSYTVTVEVTDNAGAKGSDTLTVTVNNVAPTIVSPEVGFDALIGEGELFTTTVAFTDPGADLWTASVDYGDGTGTGPISLATKNFGTSHVYADNGNYTLTVVVIDDDGAYATSSVPVSVFNVAPTVNAGSDQSSDEGSVISLAPSTFNDLGTADTHTATINWGDGSAVTTGIMTETPFVPPGSIIGADGMVSGSHVYADNGAYTVTVTVTDDEGAATSGTLVVTVNNVAPTVDAGISQTADEGSVVTLAPSTFNDLGTADTHTAT
ncbi:MAG: CSLREA domain-containing protein, partial [Chloroflexi bacterium]|nr:CSLREA domain-containing protein [Chloroflexota bacterium]